MTKEETIVFLESIKRGLYQTGKDYPYRDVLIPKMKEALCEAIKELKTESCEDCVSRRKLIDKLETIDKRYGSDFYWEVRKIVDSLPSVKPVACIAKVTFNKEDMQKIVDEKVKEMMSDDKEID